MTGGPLRHMMAQLREPNELLARVLRLTECRTRRRAFGTYRNASAMGTSGGRSSRDHVRARARRARRLRGPSGSGKTTLLAIVGAMLSPRAARSSSTARRRRALREAHRAQTRRAKVGFLFQDLPARRRDDGARERLLLRDPRWRNAGRRGARGRAARALGVANVARSARTLALRRVNASGSRSPAHSCSTRRSSFSTSRRRTSTTQCARNRW